MHTRQRLGSCVLLILSLIGAGCGREGKAVPAETKVEPVVHLGADGVARLSWDLTEGARYPLSSQDWHEQSGHVRRDQDALRALARSPAVRDADGNTSKLVLGIEVERNAQWLYVQWILRIAASPRVRIHDLALRLAGESAWTPIKVNENQEPDVLEAIPGDGRRAPPGEKWGVRQQGGKVRLYFSRMERATADAFTKVRVDHRSKFTFPKQSATGDAAFDSELERMRTFVQAVLLAGKPDVVVIKTWPPDGQAVPVSDVLAVYRMLRDLGHQEFHFDGPALPLSSRSR